VIPRFTQPRRHNPQLEWENCRYLQGDGGPGGSVRSIVDEVIVGQTQYGYSYAQPPRKDTLYNLAHGTLAAEALTPYTTRLSLYDAER
jgi:hypothetical protein